MLYSQTYSSKLLEKFKICNDLDRCLSQVDGNPKLAVAISREHAHNNRLISNSKFYCFRNSEIIYDYALKFLVRKDFSYLAQLNSFIGMTSASGLIEKWHINSRIKSQYTHSTKEYGILTIENIGVTYLGWFAIALCTILVFFVEILVHKMAKKPNARRIWKLIEMFINSDRHFWLKNKCYWK